MNKHQFNEVPFNHPKQDIKLSNFKVLVFDDKEKYKCELDLSLLIGLEEEEILRGEYTADIIYPTNARESRELKEGYSIAFPDMDNNYQLFDIVKVEEDYLGASLKVHLEHRFYELLTEPIKTLSFASVKPIESLPQVLQGTRWQLGMVSVDTRRTWAILDENPLQALRNAEALHDAYLRFRVSISDTGIDAFFVDFLSSLGEYEGLQFDFKHNLNNINITTDKSNIVTALYGRGQGEAIDEETDETERLTFENIEWSIINGDPVDKPLGQSYIGDDLAKEQYGKPDGTGGKRHIFDIYESDAKTAETLLEATWLILNRRNKLSVNIQADVIDLERVAEFEHERIRLGIPILVKVPESSIVLETTVIRIKRDRLRAENTELEFGNFRNTINDTIQDIQTTTRKTQSRQAIWDNAGDGPVQTTRLQGNINTLTNQLLASGSYQSATPVDNIGYLLENNDETSPSYGAMYLGPTGLAIASNKVNGEWEWRTFGNGAGFTADLMTIGTMLANRISGGELSLGGFDNTGGIFRLLDENGNIIILGNKDGFTLADGARIIGDGGVLSVFQFASSNTTATGATQEWGDMGLVDVGYIDKFTVGINISVPANFVITKAELTALAMPVDFQDLQAGTQKWKQSRNLKLYESDGLSGFYDYPVPSGFAAVQWRNGIDRTNDVFGINTWSPAITPLSNPIIQKRNGSILPYLTAGQDKSFYIQTTDTANSSNFANNQGLGKIIIVIEGFLKQS